MKSPTVTVTETLPVCGCIQADLQLLVILTQANDVMVRARGVQAQLPASKNKEYNDVMVHVAQFSMTTWFTWNSLVTSRSTLQK